MKTKRIGAITFSTLATALIITVSADTYAASGGWKGLDWSWWQKRQVTDFDQLRNQEHRNADFSVGSYGINGSSFLGRRIAKDLFLGLYINSTSQPVRRYFSQPYPGYENRRISLATLSPSFKFYLPWAFAKPPFVFRPYATAGLTTSFGVQMPAVFGGGSVPLPPGEQTPLEAMSYRSFNSFGWGVFGGGGMDVHLTKTVRFNLDYKYTSLRFAKPVGNRIDWTHHRWGIGISYSFLRGPQRAPTQPLLINRRGPSMTPSPAPQEPPN
jgi:hypothetical protein